MPYMHSTGSSPDLRLSPKQQICFDFTKGLCSRGSSCRYSHDLALIVSVNSQERGICFDFLRGQCNRGLLCRFSHDLSGIVAQQSEEIAKSNAPICYDFVKGVCVRGANCRYSHDLRCIIQGGKKAASGTGNICYDFAKGRCIRGLSCRYSHDLPQQQQCLPTPLIPAVSDVVHAAASAAAHDAAAAAAAGLYASYSPPHPMQRDPPVQHSDSYGRGLAPSLVAAALQQQQHAAQQQQHRQQSMSQAATDELGSILSGLGMRPGMSEEDLDLPAGCSPHSHMGADSLAGGSPLAMTDTPWGHSGMSSRTGSLGGSPQMSRTFDAWPPQAQSSGLSAHSSGLFGGSTLPSPEHAAADQENRQMHLSLREALLSQLQQHYPQPRQPTARAASDMGRGGSDMGGIGSRLPFEGAPHQLRGPSPHETFRGGSPSLERPLPGRSGLGVAREQQAEVQQQQPQQVEGDGGYMEAWRQMLHRQGSEGTRGSSSMNGHPSQFNAAGLNASAAGEQLAHARLPSVRTTLPLGYDPAAELWGMQGSSPLSAYSVAHLADDKPAMLPHAAPGAGRLPSLNGGSPAAVNSGMCGGARQQHQHLEKAGSSNASTQGDEMLEGCSPRSEDSQQLILCKQIWQNS